MKINVSECATNDLKDEVKIVIDSKENVAAANVVSTIDDEVSLPIMKYRQLIDKYCDTS